ncbi:hypothetical protein KHA80_13485 [Anaerobacillus sp. HL2]|nr:hypothetical protein KHA80_13485 [Anaerobacillus sp. HL2]
MVIPFAIGFQQVIRSTLPSYGYELWKACYISRAYYIDFKWIKLVLSFFIPIVAVTALIARELISIVQKLS